MSQQTQPIVEFYPIARTRSGHEAIWRLSPESFESAGAIAISAMNIGRVPDCTKLIRPGGRVRVRVTGREQSAHGPRINIALVDDACRRMLPGRLSVGRSS